MKKGLVALFLVTILVMSGGMVGAEQADDAKNEPVSHEVVNTEPGAGEEPAAEAPAVEEPVIADVEKEAVDEEAVDYVRPDEEGEVGITAIGIELEEGADVVATSVDEAKGPAMPTWGYALFGAALILPAATVAVRRKKDRS